MASRHGKKSRTEGDWTRPNPVEDREPGNVQFARILNRTMHAGLNRFLMILIIIILLVVVYNQWNPTDTQTTVIETDLNPTGKQVAWNTVDAWLDNQQLGENASIVSWDGSEETTVVVSNEEQDAQVHSFTVVDPDTGWWEVTQTIRESDLTPLGQPSVEAITVPDTTSVDSTSDWPDSLQSLQASTAVTTLVDQWAMALMGDDSDTLTVLMNDDPNATYTSLGIGTVSSTSIETMSYVTTDDATVDKDAETSDRALARVTITLDPVNDQTNGSQFTYDVLISDPDGIPGILAWGAPGTGCELEAYQNRAAYVEDD